MQQPLEPLRSADAQGADNAQLLLIGDLLVNVGKREVWRGKRLVKLPKLSFQLLLALAEAAPNLLSIDQLIDRVWPGRVVSPETVTQRVKLLRRALGEDAQNPKYIGLVRGEGYRLLADVSVAHDTNPARSLVAELSQRRVFQVAFMYVAVAWSLTEAATFVVTELPVFPDATNEIMAILFVVGFPVAMFLAWQFDVDRRGGIRVAAASPRGKATIASAVVLLIGMTWGLDYLIDPASKPAETTAFAPNTVAVLPFAGDSWNEDDRYISDGLGDELRDQLGRIAGLRVAARSSSMVFKDQPMEAREIAQKLGVRWLIESTFRRQGDRLRISVQIIDGETGFQAWSESFDRLLSDLLGAQQDIAMQVVSQILPSARDQVADTNLGPRNVSAHTLMLLARHMEQQVRDSALVDERLLDKAISLYQEAVQVEPDNALAHSRLASALLYEGDLGAAEEPIYRALELNPDLSDAYYSLGLLHWQRADPAGREAFRKAVELNPNNPDALTAYAMWLWNGGVVEESGELLRQALAIDPLTLQRYSDLGNYYGMMGHREGGLEIARKIEDLFPNVPGYRVLGRVYEVIGDVDLAIYWMRKAKAAQPELLDIDWRLAELHALIGDQEVAERLEPEPGIAQLFYSRRYGELIDTAELLLLDNPNDIHLYHLLAFAYNTQGYYAESKRLLELIGLPDRIKSGVLRSIDQEAAFTYVDALRALGQAAEAQQYLTATQPSVKRGIDTRIGTSWWSNVYMACAHAYLGEEEELFSYLERLPQSPGLVSYPVLRDQRCFQPYIADSRYLDVVARIETRMADQRAKVRALADPHAGAT